MGAGFELCRKSLERPLASHVPPAAQAWVTCGPQFLRAPQPCGLGDARMAPRAPPRSRFYRHGHPGPTDVLMSCLFSSSHSSRAFLGLGIPAVLSHRCPPAWNHQLQEGFFPSLAAAKVGLSTNRGPWGLQDGRSLPVGLGICTAQALL